MTPFALIPVKPPAAAKSRLRGVLADGARIELAWRLFDHVLGVAIQTVGAARTLVISRDSDVLDYATGRGAGTMAEQADRGLNAALALGRSEAVRRGADAVLILPGDLPLLAAADIDAMIAAASPPPAVVIAPDERDGGTNALLLSPPDILPFTFGENSFAAHAASARHAGVEPAIVRRPGLAFDVDTAEDCARLCRRESSRTVG